MVGEWAVSNVSFNGGATDSVSFAGPVHGRKLKPDEVKTVPIVFDSNPAIKKVGNETIAFASGAVGVQKILLTGKAFEAISFIAYPGFEQQAAKGTQTAIKSVLAEFDAARRSKDESKILVAVKAMESMGMNMETGINGVYNLFDREGFHYCVYGGSKVLKSFDANDPRGPITIVKSADVAAPCLPRWRRRLAGSSVSG